MKQQSNAYSRQWFDFFHVGIEESRTQRETELICECAPLPEFRNVLDACCGMGRHARALSACGYTVTGVDRDTTAIEEARKLNGGANYVVAEIREYQPEPETFDAAIVMGQTFGHFDSTTNCEILRRLASSVRKGGRIILDLWNPEFFTAHQGESELGTPRGIVRERKRVDHGRLFVELDYPGGNHEDFEWKLFTPAQMERLAEETGLRLVIACSGFNARNLPSPLDPRTQFVLQR